MTKGDSPATIPPNILLAAYAGGIFPMADSAEAHEIYWVEPQIRAILPLNGFHLSRSLAKRVRQDGFTVTTDLCFDTVVARCAESAPDREDTWINATIRNSYSRLHAIGHAHSVECWRDDALVGGLYGVSLGGAFFGESMFSRVTDASKVALAWLVARLKVGRFSLLDCQFQTDHLQSLGAVEMPQKTYLAMLQSAVAGVAAALGAGAGAAVGAAGAGADDDAAAPAPDWAALDALLAAPDAARGDAVRGVAPFSGTSRSPGQLIVQLLTNTS